MQQNQSLSCYEIVNRAFQVALRPVPYKNVSEWADEKRVIPAKGAAEPGRWRTSRTPYLREIMDAASPGSGTTEIVMQFGTQLGKTEMLFNVMGAVIDLYPAPIMFVQPTVETVQRVSKQRIQPTLDETPCLAAVVSDPRSRSGQNTIQLKEFPGGVLIMTGANSGVGLRSMPAKVVLLDEVDGYPANVDGEGDPVELAKKRASNFPGRKIIQVSTPKEKGRSKIESARLDPRATDEHFQVPCPKCEAFQPLVFDRGAGGGGLRWSARDTKKGKVVERAWYECAACGFEIDNDRHKTAMLAAGVWVARNKHADGSVRSFHMNSLYSPVGWYTWADAAQAWLSANQLKKEGDIEPLRVFINTVLAETFENNPGAATEVDDIKGRGEDYDARDGTLPAGAVLLTMAVDVQKDRLEGEITAWGRDEESWRVEYFRAMGDPGRIKGPSSPWLDVAQRLSMKWETATGAEVQISATAIDSGGHHSTSVYDWVRPRQARRVWACKGSSTPGQELFRLGKPKAGRVTLLMIGTEGGKDLVMSRLQVEEHGPGFTHFPVHYPLEYYEGLTAEVAKPSRHRGKDVTRWVKKRPGMANEPLDLAVLNLVALRTLGRVNWDSLERRKAPKKEPERKPKPGRPGAGGFAKGWRSGLT